jgi:hypothetical protein
MSGTVAEGADAASSSTSQYAMRSARMSCMPDKRAYSWACKRCRQFSVREPRPWPRLSIGPASTVRRATSASSDSACQASTRAWTTRTTARRPTGSRSVTTSLALALETGLGRAGSGSMTTPSGLRAEALGEGEAEGEGSAEGNSMAATWAPPHATAAVAVKTRTASLRSRGKAAGSEHGVLEGPRVPAVATVVAGTEPRRRRGGVRLMLNRVSY